MRVLRPLILCLLLVLSSLPLQSVSAESETVCCEYGPVDLYFTSEGSMTPFQASLPTSGEEFTITDSIAQQQEIASWRLNPAWTGDYPTEDWTFEIAYEVKNAGGAQINATVEVEIGGNVYSGATAPGNSFLASGTGTLSITVSVDAGAIPSSTDLSVTLIAQTVVFSVPAGDAGLTFYWGGSDDESLISANLPLVDLIVEDPVTEGMDVHVSLVIASPWGEAAAAHVNLLEIKVNNNMLNNDPIATKAQEYVRLTWTWEATESGEQNITIEASIQIQAGTPVLSGSSEFMISTVDDGSGGGGGFYPTEEPLRSDGGGSPLMVQVSMDLERIDGQLALKRRTILTMDEEIAYWMRWGMDNIGNEDPGMSQALRIFRSGSVGQEHMRNRVIDQVEITEFENQMVNLAVTYMNDGMALELDELIGNDINEFERIGFEINLHGEERVTPHPISMTITTLEVIAENQVLTLLSDFIIVQPIPIWANFDLVIDIDTDSMSSLTGATIKGEDGLTLTHRRGLFGESIRIDSIELEPDATFVLSALPTTSPLNAPMSLTVLTLILVIGGFWLSLKITKHKRRSALWLELMLAPIIFLALYLAYPPFQVGVTAGIAVIIWWITAVASPRRKGSKKEKAMVYPSINCPACATSNTIASDIRPMRMPCEGCSRILKIVE
ncbi:MAG TPA: hypothetical protein EYQ73_02120 [Candidatus Poseidoniales archaeon]|nr:hypothetical protein [Candidatus Poseidoniales archaeon]HIL65666.1 hypothetical protein [Candidatus Poseidoniales archaeon]